MYIASASTVVQFHEFPSNQLIYTYQPTSKIAGSCRSLSWTKEGSWLAVVPNSGFVEIVLVKGECKHLHSVKDVSEPSCASFQNLTKRIVAIGTKNGQVLIYDAKAGKIKTRYPRTSSAITHVGFTAKDTHCYAGCSNGNIFLFNSAANTLSCTLKVPKSNSVTDVKAHLQKRNFLIGGSNEGIVCVWDVNANKVMFQTEAHSGPVTSTIFSPANSALIVSAGLDRVVRVFDIENRSRIASIPVQNNVLSLDFLENSLYIAMGAQNGQMHIYDTRKLQNPVSTFDSHKSAVRHIAYQKSLGEGLDNNSSLYSIAGEESLPKPSKSNEEVHATRKRTSDFFGLVSQSPSSVSETFDGAKQPHLSSMEAGDSFIRALGLSNTGDSIKDDHVFIDEADSKPPAPPKLNLESKDVHTPNPVKTIHNKLGLYDSKLRRQPTSTPNCYSQNSFIGVSPIIASNTNQTNNTPPTLEEKSNVQKGVSQEQLKKTLEEFETRMTYLFMNQTHQIRRMVLDLHMATLKEFIKLEDYYAIIREEMNVEPAKKRESFLVEENFNLKKKIQELECQVAILSCRDEENGNK